MKFIFEVIIKGGHTEEEYVNAWKKGSEIIQASPGAQGTILYKKIDEPNKLVAIATWASKEERDLAMKKLRDAGAQIDLHKEFGDTHALGNFEEIARVDTKI